jgi:HD-GYP domain-containing protein (c-di-GMP phosphodiesterase class II)
LRIYTSEILEQVEDILNIGIALSAEKDHNRLLEMIVTEARRITGADGGTLYLCESDHLIFKIIQNDTMQTYKGGMGEPVNLPPVPMRLENVSSYVALNNHIVNIPDVYEADGFDFSGPKNYDKITGYRTGSMLVIPLENHQRDVIGVLQLLNAKDGTGNTIPFAPYFEKVISSLASQAAISLTNMQLLADIERLFNSFVEVMATAIDSRTPYNANHTRRVALLSGELARIIDGVKEDKWAEIDFSEDRIAQLVMAGWLHDIGKIATPLSVMNKSSRIEAQIELVLQRLDYIEASLKSHYLEQKLALLNIGDISSIQSLDDKWQEEKKLMQETRDLIIKVDHPATFVDKEILEKVHAIANRTYLDQAGNEHTWLTESELTALSVIKGTLTEAERQVMEDHVVITERMLDKIPFTRKLKEVPYFASIHHEHLDGKGYPRGLTGDEIPLEGRILALVDVFDALTAADRPYKKAMSTDQALKILGFMVKDGELDGDLLQLFTEKTVWERIAD